MIDYILRGFDTGASLVAINVSTARRLGFSPAALDFQHQVRTANGSTKAAYVVLDRIEIGKDDYVGRRGPITEKIQTAFFDIVNGRNPKYAHWLTKV